MCVCRSSACVPSLESVNDAGDSVLSVACTRGHVSVIVYLVKDKGCDLDGEIIVLCTLVYGGREEHSAPTYCITLSAPVYPITSPTYFLFQVFVALSHTKWECVPLLLVWYLVCAVLPILHAVSALRASECCW